MVTSGTGSATISRSGQAVEPRRVIGTDGIEREIVGLADWISALQSNTVDDQCLFFDPEAQRWRPVSTLDIYCSAKTAGRPDAKAPDPADFSAAQNAAPDMPVPLPVAPASSFSPKRAARRTAAVWLFLGIAGILALAAWAGGVPPWLAVQSGLREVLLPALIAGAALALMVVAEEFFWFALRLVGLAETHLTGRLGTQTLALLSTALVSYVMFGPFPAAAPEAALGAFVRNAPAIGVIYALATFLWSLPLIALPPAAHLRRALASVVAAAMLIGMLYMALAPLATHGDATRPARTSLRAIPLLLHEAQRPSAARLQLSALAIVTGYRMTDYDGYGEREADRKRRV